MNGGTGQEGAAEQCWTLLHATKRRQVENKSERVGAGVRGEGLAWKEALGDRRREGRNVKRTREGRCFAGFRGPGRAKEEGGRLSDPNKSINATPPRTAAIPSSPFPQLNAPYRLCFLLLSGLAAGRIVRLCRVQPDTHNVIIHRRQHRRERDRKWDAVRSERKCGIGPNSWPLPLAHHHLYSLTPLPLPLPFPPITTLNGQRGLPSLAARCQEPRAARSPRPAPSVRPLSPSRPLSST